MKRLSLILVTLFVMVFAGFSQDTFAQKPLDLEPFLDILPMSARGRATDDLPRMQERGFIRALVTLNHTDFFFIDGNPQGSQAELLQEFQDHLNRTHLKEKPKTAVVYIPVPFNELLPALEEGRGDIVAATLTVTPARKKDVAFSNVSGRQIDEVVVSRSDVKDLLSLEDLSGRRVYVLRGSSYTDHLKALNRKFRKQGLKPIRIEEADPLLQTEDILEMVNAGIVDITVADDVMAELWAQVLPNLTVHSDLQVHTDGRYGWAVRKNNPDLLNLLNEFAKEIKPGTSTGDAIFKKYYENTKWIKDSISKEEQELEVRYDSLFKKYGRRYNIDYLALAAQAYQESGLMQDRRSDQGAVGIMQVLPATAAQMGIKNIYNVENNIHAGAKYLAYLRDTYFSGAMISRDNRLFFAWAAYNAGPGRINEMRDKASEMGLDPNLWFNNVEYSTLKYVGPQPVRYVTGTYKYYVAYRLVRDLVKQKPDPIPDETPSSSSP